MTLFHSLILGTLQGLTEFLPISSSGHLVLMETYLGLPLSHETLQSFDVVLHAGSLLAILLYFRSTWISILQKPFAKQKDGDPPLLLLLLLATIPVCITGFFLQDWIETNARTPLFVGVMLILTGGILISSSFFEYHYPGNARFGWKQAVMMSIGQALAIFPGLSRSGLTLASGRFSGLEAVQATRYAFLLGAPAIGAAFLYTLITNFESALAISWPLLTVGLTSSLVSSLLFMHLFLSCMRRYGVWMWSIYLFLVGLLVLGDELLPLISQFSEIATSLPLAVILTLVFVALLLEAIPLTTTFVPGMTTLVTLGLLLKGEWLTIGTCIPVGVTAMIIGNLIGYLPARQARRSINWKEKANRNLQRAQLFFEKWGFWAVFLGGFYGPARSFISIAAGMANMPPRKYISAMVVGAIVWVSGLLFGASFIGTLF